MAPDGRWILTAAADREPLLWEGASGRLLARLQGHREEVTTAQLSRNGQLILTGSADHSARIWDRTTATLRLTLAGHTESITAASFSGDGLRVATASKFGTVKIWDTALGAELDEFQHPDIPSFLYFLPDGVTVVARSEQRFLLRNTAQRKNLIEVSKGLWNFLPGSIDPLGEFLLTESFDTLHLWPLLHRPSPRELKGHDDHIVAAIFSTDGSRILTGSDDRTARIWDRNTGRTVAVLSGHNGPVSQLAFSADGKRVATGTDLNVWVWDAESGSRLALLEADVSYARSIAFCPDGKTIVAAAGRGAVVCDVDSGKTLTRLGGQSIIANDLSFSKDGTRIALGFSDHTACVINFEEGRMVALLTEHFGTVNNLYLNPDGSRLITCDNSYSTITLWDVQTHKSIAAFQYGNEEPIELCAAFDDQGKHIVTALGNEADVWDGKSGQHRLSLGLDGGWLKSVRFGADGRFVVGTLGDSVCLWSLDSADPLVVLNRFKRPPQDAWLSPDGQAILVVTEYRASLWSANDGTFLSRFSGHGRSITAALFTTDGSCVITGAHDHSVRIWEASTGKLLHYCRGHDDSITALALHPGGALLASASRDHTVRCWDIRSGQLIQLFAGHSGIVLAAAFSPDGKFLLTTSEDSTLRIWSVETGEEILRWAKTDASHWITMTPDGKVETAGWASEAGTTDEKKLRPGLWQEELMRYSLK